jgi:hypothetical protein
MTGGEVETDKHVELRQLVERLESLTSEQPTGPWSATKYMAVGQVIDKLGSFVGLEPLPVFKYSYPDEPDEKAVFMFGLQFFRLNPNRYMQMTDLEGKPLAPRIPVNEIICDTCNAEIHLWEPCCEVLNRLYCWDCTKKWILQYIVKPSR